MLDTDIWSTLILLTLRINFSSGISNEIFHLSSTLEEQGSLAQSVTLRRSTVRSQAMKVEALIKSKEEMSLLSCDVSWWETVVRQSSCLGYEIVKNIRLQNSLLIGNKILKCMPNCLIGSSHYFVSLSIRRLYAVKLPFEAFDL